MFLDEKGEKISKSKGNGLSIDEWLTYGPDESLAFYIYREPKKAKSLHLGRDPARGRRILAVPRQLSGAGRSSSGSATRCTISITARCRRTTMPVTFGLLLNLVGVMGEATKEQVWGYLAQLRARCDAGGLSRARPADRLCAGLCAAISSRRRCVRRAPEGVEVAALQRLDAELAALPADAQRPRTSRTSSTRSARPAASPSCATGSRRCTRRCSGRARGRAWAASSRSTASRTRRKLIAEALAR